MRKLINGKIRDTKNLTRIAGSDGNRNDCYGRYQYLMRDDRDGLYFLWCGNWWSGLGPDTLSVVDDPIEHIEESGYELSNEDTVLIDAIISQRAGA